MQPLLIDKLAKKTESVRLNAVDVENIRTYLNANTQFTPENFGDLFRHLLQTAGKPDENSEQTIDTLAKALQDLHTENNNLQTQLTTLQEVNHRLNDENNALKSGGASDKPQALGIDTRGLDESLLNTEIPSADYLDLLDSPQYPSLRFLKGFVDENTKHLGDVLVAYRKAAENTIHGMMLNPLMLLDDKEYEVLKKWDEETFLHKLVENIGPEKLAEYGITDLTQVLTGKHKFMMMWDFCLTDPAQKVIEIVPNLTPQQLEQLNDISFPRPQIVLQCLQDISNHIEKLNDNPNDTTNLVEQIETTENGNQQPAGSTDTPIIDITTRKPVDTTSADTANQS